MSATPNIVYDDYDDILNPAPNIMCDDDHVFDDLLTPELKLPVAPPPSPKPEDDGTDMLGYIKEIFEPDDTVLFQLLHPTKPPIESADSLDVALEPNTVTSIADRQAEGYNAFVCMNPVDPVAKNRQKQNIAAIRTVYIDVDDDGKAVFDAVNASVKASEIPAPHFFIGSSEGKFYAVWRVEGFTVDLQEALNRALAQKFGADKQSTDAGRVLRLPGTKNLKYAPPPTCAIFKQNPGPRLKPTDFKIDFAAQAPAARVTVEDDVLQDKMDDVRGFLDWAGILYNEKRAADGGILAVFQCPFEHKSGHHDGEAFAGVGTLDKTGNFRFECKHDSCKGIGWKEFRKGVEALVGSSYVFGADLLIKSPSTPSVETTHAEQSTDDETTGMVVDRPKLLTEVGNGRRLIETYGRNLRYCSDDDCWLYFDGKVWLKDKRSVRVHDLMKRVLMSMQQEASSVSSSLEPELASKLTKDLTPKKIIVPLTAEELEEGQKIGSKAKTKKIDVRLSAEEWQIVENFRTAEAFKDWSKQSESNQKISGSVNQAKSEPGISIAKSALDTNTLVCNVENGAFRFDPESGSVAFGKHKRDDFATKMMPVTYDPTADCPLFKVFIAWMFPEKGVQDYVQTYLGLCLTGITVRKILILYGEGANGKSTLMKVLYRMFGEALDASGSVVGEAYTQSVAFSTFTVGRDETAGGARADLLPLKGAHLITASESNKSSGKYHARLDMARLKEMTGGDPTVARGLYQADLTRFVNQGKIILQTNNIPAIDDDSDGAWDRLELLSCKSRIEEEDQDEGLPERLYSESSGILNWMLEGLTMYFRKGLVETESMNADTEAYRGSENHMGRFVEEECDVVDKDSIRALTSVIYRRYTCWCAENGESDESQKALTQYLQRKHKVTSKHTREGNFLCKIRLKPTSEGEQSQAAREIPY